MTLSDELKQEANDFVEFFLTRIQEKNRSKNKKAGLAKGLIEMKGDFD